MNSKSETPRQVEHWFREQADRLWPAGLGSLSLRKSPCIRENCEACRSGLQHPSYVLYVRTHGRRFTVYVPDELVPDIRQCLDNGRALQELLCQTVVRYTKALKQERTRRVQKEKP